MLCIDGRIEYCVMMSRMHTHEQFQRYGRDICSKNLKYKFSENANVNNIRTHLLIFL